MHKKCLEARDYAGCVNTNKKFSRKKDKEISGIGIRLFLNSVTAELTIQSVINDSPAAAANIKPNDCLLYTSPSPRDGRISRMPSSA